MSVPTEGGKRLILAVVPGLILSETSEGEEVPAAMRIPHSGYKNERGRPPGSTILNVTTCADKASVTKDAGPREYRSASHWISIPRLRFTPRSGEYHAFKVD